MEITNERMLELLEHPNSDINAKRIDFVLQKLYRLPQRGGDIHRSLDFIWEEDRNVFTLAQRLMTSGTAAGSEMVRYVFISELTDTTRLMSDAGEFNDWQDHVKDGAYLRALMMEAWCVASLAEELGTSTLIKDIKGIMTTTRFMDGWRRQHHPQTAPRYDETYWRGIAILAATEAVPLFTPEPAHAREFMEWAAVQPNVKEIVQIVRERGVILPPETIRGLLEQTDFSDPLHIGIL